MIRRFDDEIPETYLAEIIKIATLMLKENSKQVVKGVLVLYMVNS